MFNSRTVPKWRELLPLSVPKCNVKMPCVAFHCWFPANHLLICKWQGVVVVSRPRTFGSADWLLCVCVLLL